MEKNIKEGIKLNLNTIYDRLRDIGCTDQKLMIVSEIGPEDGSSGKVCPEGFSPDELFMIPATVTLLEPFQEFRSTPGRLPLPTHGVYHLSPMPGGRYGYVEDTGMTFLFSSMFPSGVPMTKDFPSEKPRRVPLLVEYSWNGYYLYGYSETRLEVLLVMERSKHAAITKTQTKGDMSNEHHKTADAYPPA